MADKIVISYKDHLYKEVLYDVEEYYCTEKMFFIREKSGFAHYYSLDEIFEIHICEQEKGYAKKEAK